MRKLNKRLGEMLIDKKLLSKEQLDVALEEQKRTKEFLGEILVRKRYIKEMDLLEALSEQFNMPVASLKNRYIDWKLLKQFSPSLIMDYRAFPIEQGEFSITVALTNPLDAWAMKRIEEEAMGLKPKFVLVLRSDMEDAIVRYKEYMLGEIFKQFE